jgi:hypothetical protein
VGAQYRAGDREDDRGDHYWPADDLHCGRWFIVAELFEQLNEHCRESHR